MVELTTKDGGRWLETKDLQEALKALKGEDGNGDVVVLDMSCNPFDRRAGFGVKGAKAIGEALKSNGTLASLNLAYNQIGGEGAKAIGEALKSNGTLSRLDLEENQLGDEGAKAIGEALKSNGALTGLDLKDNQIGHEGAMAIGEALKSNGTLTSLDLSYNQIGHEGAKAIGEALKSNGTLTSLNLQWNEIGSEEAIAIFCSLEHRASSSPNDGNELKWDFGTEVPAMSTSLHTPTPALEMIKRLIENGKGNFAVNISQKLGTDEIKAFANGWQQLKQKGVSDLAMPPESVIHQGAANIGSFLDAKGRVLNTGDLQEALRTLKVEDGEGYVVELAMTGAGIGAEGAKAIGEALKSNGTLTRLDLRSNGIGVKGTKAIGEALKSNGTLTSLNLWKNQIGVEGAKAIGDALKSNGTLTRLNLVNNQIGDEGAKAIGEALKSNGALTSLYLGGNRIGSEGAKVIVEGVKSNLTLTTLNIGGNQISDEGAKVIGETLGSNRTLISLELASNRIGAEGAKAIAEGLKSNEALTSLDLRENQIGSEGSIAILTSLEYNKSLMNMELGGISIQKEASAHVHNLTARNIGDEKAKAIGEALKSSGTFTQLNLGDNRIGDEGAKAIGEALQSNGTLSSLNLGRNKVGDEGAKAIGVALKSNETLTSLDLEENQIGDEGAKAIGEALKSNETLTSLDLEQNQIGDEGAKAIGEGLKSNGILTRMDLRVNKIGDEGAEAIGEALKSNGTLISWNLERNNQIGDAGAMAIVLSFEHKTELKPDISGGIKKQSISFNPATNQPTNALAMIKRLIENGRSDHAVEIAREFGDELFQLFTEEWKKSFEQGIKACLVPPESIIANGIDAVKSFFSSLQDHGADTRKRIVLLVLGDANAGKTSLIRSILSGKVNPTKPGPNRATMAVDMIEWFPELQRANDEQHAITFLDFGGQEQYFTTHTLFLSRNATTLLVFDLYKLSQDPDGYFEQALMFWVRNVRSKVLGPEFVVVATHCDQIRTKSTRDCLCQDVLDKLRNENEKYKRSLQASKADLVERIATCKKEAEAGKKNIGSLIQRMKAAQQSLQETEKRLQNFPSFCDEVYQVSCKKKMSHVIFPKNKAIEAIDAVKAKVIDITSQKGNQLPYSYVRLKMSLAEKAHQMRKENQFPVLSFGEIEEVESTRDGYTSENLHQRLQFLSDLGSIIYYQGQGNSSGSSSSNNMRDYIIFPSPSAVIDALKQLIRHDMLAEYEGKLPYLPQVVDNHNQRMTDSDSQLDLKKVSEDLQHAGILPLSLLKEFDEWKDALQQGQHCFDAMVQMIQHFKLGFVDNNARTLFLPYYLSTANQSGSGSGPGSVHSSVGNGDDDLTKDLCEKGHWKFSFPKFTPPGFFERLLVSVYSMDHHVDSNRSQVAPSLQLKSKNSFCKSMSEPIKMTIEISLERIAENASHEDLLRSGSNLHLKMRGVDPSDGDNNNDDDDDKVNVQRELWKEFRRHSTLVESLLSEFPGLDVDRYAVSTEGKEFPMDYCDRVRSDGESFIDNIELNSLIGPPSAQPLVQKPGTELMLPAGFKFHIVLACASGMGLYQTHLLENELKSRGLTTNLITNNEEKGCSPEIIRQSFCAVFFLSKGVFEDDLVQRAIVETIRQGRCVAFFYEKESTNTSFTFGEIGSAPEVLKPVLSKLQSQLVFTDLQRDRTHMKIDLDKFVEALGIRLDYALFEEAKDLFEGVQLSETSLGLIGSLVLHELNDDECRELETKFPRVVPDSDYQDSNSDYSTVLQRRRSLRMQPERPLPSGRHLHLLYHVFLSHMQATAGYQCQILFQQLQFRGIKTWLDMNQQDRTTEGMKRGVEKSSCYLLFLSKQVLTRPFVVFELLCAIEAGKPMIVLREDTLEASKFVDEVEERECPPAVLFLFKKVLALEQFSFRPDDSQLSDSLADKIGSGDGQRIEVDTSSQEWRELKRWLQNENPALVHS